MVVYGAQGKAHQEINFWILHSRYCFMNSENSDDKIVSIVALKEIIFNRLEAIPPSPLSPRVIE